MRRRKASRAGRMLGYASIGGAEEGYDWWVYAYAGAGSCFVLNLVAAYFLSVLLDGLLLLRERVALGPLPSGCREL